MASRGMPSLMALLGLLAVAGYQNRDKISDWMKSAGGGGEAGPAPGSQSTGQEQGGPVGGLGELIDRFKNAGQAEAADSWVKSGPNRSLTPDQVAQALGEDDVQDLVSKTGLSRDELLKRLSTHIPAGVDHFTPEGRLPTAAEAARFMSR